MSQHLSSSGFPVGPAFRSIRESMAGRLTFTCLDVFAATGLPRPLIATTVNSMLRGGHVRRVSRGVYRFRGVV